MARPAFIIGLGGTGQWVLTYLKNELMEINSGVMPQEVQLLGIDTQSPDVKLLGAGQAAAGGDVDGRMNQLTDAQVGNIRLDRINEFHQIGGELLTLINEISRSNPPRREYDWLDTDYLQKLGPLVCNTIYGAGAYRQLGRLSLFKNVSAIYHRLFQGLQRGQAAIANQALGAGQNNSLSVVIVTSIAGGTGAGIFLDIAWLIRTAARNLGIEGQYNLSGFIVMPTAWEMAGQDTKKRLRAYAAWKELDRFMLDPVDLQTPQKISYLPDMNPPIEAICDTRVFDNTYIIDPDLTALGLTQKQPEEATYPVVAQVISSLVDNRIGQVMALDMANVAASIGQLKYDVYHNSVGAFTFKTPHNFAKQQCFNEYSMAVLERFLEPNFGPSGEVLSIKGDRNQEAHPSDTASGASTFLSAALQGQLHNNALLPHIETVSGKGGELDKYAIEEALKVVDRKGATFQAMTTGVVDPELTMDLRTLATERLWQVVPPSGARPNATPSSIKQDVLNGVSAYDVQSYGQWGYVADPKNPAIKIETRVTEGTKVQLLKRTAVELATNYKALLREWTARELNGLDANPSVAKGGKLGYVIGVYGELDKKFDQYLAYLEKMKKKISEGKTLTKRTEARDRARKSYDLMAGKESLFAFFDNNVHPKAREAERAFLRSADKLMEYYLSEYVLSSLGDAVRAIQQFTLASKKNLERWSRVLAVGKKDGDPDKQYGSLYECGWGIVRNGVNGLQAETNMGNPTFEQNGQLGGVQQMLDVQTADTHYQNNNRVAEYARPNPQLHPYIITPEIEAGIDAFVWAVGEQPGGQMLNFGLGMRNAGNQVSQFNNSETNSATAENYSLYTKVVNPFFVNQADQAVGTPIVNLLRGQFPNTSQLAENLKTLSRPFYQHRIGGGVPYQFNNMFMRLDANSDNAYFQSLELDVRRQLAGAQESINPLSNFGAVTSQDPYKFTFSQFHYLMPTKKFGLMGALENLFQQTMGRLDLAADPANNYVFNAEKSAHQFALKKARLDNSNFSSFTPELVALLEQPERVNLFFLAFAQGLLVLTEGAGIQNTVWSLMGIDGLQPVVLFDANETNLPPERRKTVYEALYYWNVGKDRRPQYNMVNFINWDTLRSTIISNETGVTREQVLNDYKNHMDSQNPNSIVTLINLHRNRRNNIVNNVIVAGQNRGVVNTDQSKLFTDLADLAKVIYSERVRIYEDRGGWNF